MIYRDGCLFLFLATQTVIITAKIKQISLWSEQLGLYLGIFEDKLRYFSNKGELIPTPQEAALQERLANEQAEQRLEIFAEKLRKLGIHTEEM